MNKEEMLRNLEYAYEKLKDKPTFTGEINVGCMISDVISFIKKNIEAKEASEDCISREYLLSKVYDMDNDHLVVDLKDIEDAPSVIPKLPTGEWIKNENGTYSCSECQTWLPEEQNHYARYCLYCGAKMKGDDTK